MSIPTGPTAVVWDITYACPLRCIHCYSESGRRATRQLGHDDMLRVTDSIISLQPNSVAIAGGEPLVVQSIFDVAARMSRAGIAVTLYTSGWPLKPWMADQLADVFYRVSVSIDGATPEVHDRIRGRAGSFQRAMHALTLLDDAARKLALSGTGPLRFGIDYAVVRSNFHQMEELCATIAPRFPEMQFIFFGAAVPSGLASRVTFADHELLTDAQTSQLVSAEQVQRLQSLAPPSVKVLTMDNRMLQMHPDQLANGMAFPVIQVEPDGEVRAMAMYEGTVGSLLTESPTVLWERAVARWSDPFVIENLSAVVTPHEWAQAVRRIDHHFGTNEVKARIARRPELRSRHRQEVTGKTHSADAGFDSTEVCSDGN